MSKDSAIKPNMRHAAMALALFLCAPLSGCGGSHAVYAPADNWWIGTRATFGPPMAYITHLPSGYSDKEVIRIGRVLTTLAVANDDKQYIQIMSYVIITPIPEELAFEVIAIFTRVHDGYARVFAHDYNVVVLKDSHGNVSTMLFSEFQEYERERVRSLTGGRKN